MWGTCVRGNAGARRRRAIEGGRDGLGSGVVVDNHAVAIVISQNPLQAGHFAAPLTLPRPLLMLADTLLQR